VTITVTNSASITVPADSFGPGKSVGPNAVDAFAAAAAAVGVNPTDVKVGLVGGNAAANKYAEEHLPQIQRNNAAASTPAVHVPKVTSEPKVTTSEPKVASKASHAEELERLHWHMHNSVKETGMDVRAAAKAAIGVVATKEEEHVKEQNMVGAGKWWEQEAAKAGRQEGADLVNTAFKASTVTEKVTEVKPKKVPTKKSSERKETWAEVINKRSEEERRREVQMAGLTADAGHLESQGGQLEPPTEGA